MGVAELFSGNNGDRRFVLLRGYQETVSLDSRCRFRVPDELAALIQAELGRLKAASSSELPPMAYQRLAFYFVPGTRGRIFLYPVPNIDLAIRLFESPPPGMDPAQVRRARDYLYLRMRFVEADKQNRLIIPEGLRQHGGIDEKVQQVTLVGRNYWLELMRSEQVEERIAAEREAFEELGDDLLDPVYGNASRDAAPPEAIQ